MKKRSAQNRGGRSIERAKPVATSSGSGDAELVRPVIGHAAMRGSVGKARIGNSGKLSFSGASRCGTFARRSHVCSSHGPSALSPSALSESVLVGVPIGGAATV